MEEAGMRARFAAGLGLIGLIAALCAAPATFAETTTIGAAATTGPTGGAAANFTVVQRATDPASPSFAVPQVSAGGGSWSVRSWGALGGAGDGSASLEIWRPTGTTGELRLIAIGPQQDFPTGVLTTHTVSIPVQAGDHLGVLTGPDTDFGAYYGSGGHPGDEAIWPNSPTVPAVGQTIGAPGSDFYPNGGVSSTRANVQATLTSTPAGTGVPAPTTKCKKKKKKHKRAAQSSKKKKCKKHKKK
jgi:hypothetical protein